ncbi:MAG TPA: sterol desaturase family protein [Stellaceae bacterium]|nr:sterol desaturase family protein [Stellaceae bacterium]
MHGLTFAVIAATVVVVCAGAAEMICPWRPGGIETARRWSTNVALFALSYGLGFAVTPIVAAMAAMVHLSLVRSLNAEVLRLAAAFICLDLLDYALHRASHRVDWLWRLHQAHHSDVKLDVTTTFRHHPFEAATTSVVIGGSGLLMGFSIPEIAIYGAVSVVIQVVAHANVALPRQLTDLIAPVLVTPDFHRIHHSRQWSEADTNYGQIFSFWDRMFGSLRVGDAHAVEFGLDPRGKPQYQRLSALLAQPLRHAEEQIYPMRAPDGAD